MKHNFDEKVDRRKTHSRKWGYMHSKISNPHAIPMWIADGEFLCPEVIVENITKRAKHGIFGYSYVPEEFYQVTKEYVKDKYKYNINEQDILFAPGVVPAITCVITALTKPGDGVIIQGPVYHPFTSVCKETARLVMDDELIYKENKYSIDFENFEKIAKSDNAKMFLLCNPHNPTGRVFTEEEVRKLAEICAQNKVLVISDEIHSDIVLNGNKHIAFGSVDECDEENLITFYAPSKTFNIAGLQASACVVKNKEKRQLIEKQMLKNHINIPNAFAMEAYITAYTSCDTYRVEMLKYLEESFDILDEKLKLDMPKIKLVKAEGTYFAWLDCRELKFNPTELKAFFIEKCGIGLYMGDVFGESGEGFVRLNIACNKEMLERVLDQIQAEYDEIF